MQGHTGDAVAVRNAIAEIARRLDFDVTVLQHHPWPAFVVPLSGKESPGVDVPLGENDWCICSVLDHAPDWVLFTSGLFHNVPMEQPVLDAVNSMNSEITIGRYLAVPSLDAPEQVSILFQKGERREHLANPRHVKFCLTENGERVAYGSRLLLAEHGVYGEWYDWTPGNIERLYSEHL